MGKGVGQKKNYEKNNLSYDETDRKIREQTHTKKQQPTTQKKNTLKNLKKFLCII
jgi:hypothetical protein